MIIALLARLSVLVIMSTMRVFHGTRLLRHVRSDGRGYFTPN